MKLKITRTFSPGRVAHSVSGFRIRASLRKLSEKTASSQMVAKAPRPLRRPVLPPADPSLNKVGDRRGINIRENPPSSEHMKKVRAMRKFYNKKMPELQCSNCSFASQCPQFRSGYVCAFQPFLKSHKIESTEDLIFYMKELLSSTMRRTQLTLLMETLTGAAPSLEVSEALTLAFNNLKQFHELVTTQDSISVELDDPNGSLIGRLFGGLQNLVEDTKEAGSKPIDVQAIVSPQGKTNEYGESELTGESGVRKDLLLEHSKESPVPLATSNNKALQIANSILGI